MALVYSVPQLSSIQFSHLPQRGWSNPVPLPLSTINLTFDCCDIENFENLFQVSLNILEITVGSDSYPFFHNSMNIMGRNSDSRAQHLLFPSVMKLNIDTGTQSFDLLRHLDFPRVTCVEVTLGLYDARDISYSGSSYTRIERRMLNFSRLESLVLPADWEFANVLQIFQEDFGELSKEMFRQRGVAVEYR